MDKQNNIQKIDDQSLVKTTDYSDKSQIATAENVVVRIINKEETLMSKFFPSKEDKARREKDVELIQQALGDRNKMYAILKETQVKNFREAANVFLSDQMIKSKTYLSEKLTEAINDAAAKLENEQVRFYETLQKKVDAVNNWEGSLKEKFQRTTDKEIDNLIEQFITLKYNLLNDLHAIKDNLIK